MSRIVGEARVEREKDQDRLLAWYRQHGFAISEKRNKAGEMVHGIELKLDSISDGAAGGTSAIPRPYSRMR